MNITFRPALTSDTDFARRVHHAAYRDIVIKQFGSWDEQTQDKLFAASWNNPGFQIVLCDGRPCGFIRIEKTSETIAIHELVLSPTFQGLGIGTTLLKNTIATAEANKLPIKLQVLKQNRAAGLYARLGFKKVGSTDKHIIMTRQS